MSEGNRGVVRESAREIVVVVASILIAFSLDAWWDSSVERRLERDLLANLLQEFRESQAPLDQRLANHQRVRAGTSALADMLQSAVVDSLTVPDSLLVALLMSPTFDPRLGTLEEAKSAGRLSLIRNRELRLMLSSWYGRWQDAREEEELGVRLVERELFPAIGRSVSLAHLMDHGLAWVRGDSPVALVGSATTVPVTPGLLNFARARSQRSDLVLSELSELKAYFEAVIALLEEEVRE